jgi:hypothetical protein
MLVLLLLGDLRRCGLGVNDIIQGRIHRRFMDSPAFSLLAS